MSGFRAPMRIYRWLLRGYPQHFRAGFGDEMIATFGEAQHAAALKGRLALLLLWLRELRDLPVYMLSERLAGRREHGEAQMAQEAHPSTVPDGPPWPWTPAEAWPVIALFVAYGVAQVAATYVSLLISNPAVLGAVVSGALMAAMFLLPLAGLIVAARLRFPRWGYAYLGQVLSIFVLAAAFAVQTAPVLTVFLVLILLLAPALPAVRRLIGQVWRDPALVSLAGYGFMPLAISIAFDDSHRNSVTGYMALVAGVLPAGAWLYMRSTQAWQKYLALWLAAMTILFLALLDLGHFAGGVDAAVQTVRGVTPAGHILTLMQNLTVLLLAPALLVPLRRVLSLRASWGG